MQGKVTFNNTAGAALRAVRVIIETDKGVFEAGVPLQGTLGSVTQVGFTVLHPGPVKNVEDVRKRVEAATLTGKRESYYGKR